MMDPMSTVEKIVKLALLIRKAMDAVQQNKKACGDIRRTVDTISSIASRLKKNAAAMKDQATRSALGHLEKTLQLALKLVKECHEKKNHLLARLLGAPDLSEKLRRVKQEISDNVNVLNLALNSLAHHQRAAGGGSLVPTLRVLCNSCSAYSYLPTSIH
jgi:hypothetical protein